jgi:hypothetical protein
MYGYTVNAIVAAFLLIVDIFLSSWSLYLFRKK